MLYTHYVLVPDIYIAFRERPSTTNSLNAVVSLLSCNFVASVAQGPWWISVLQYHPCISILSCASERLKCTSHLSLLALLLPEELSCWFIKNYPIENACHTNGCLQVGSAASVDFATGRHSLPTCKVRATINTTVYNQLKRFVFFYKSRNYRKAIPWKVGGNSKGSTNWQQGAYYKQRTEILTNILIKLLTSIQHLSRWY